MAGGSVDKAYFVNRDQNATGTENAFYVQYNPKDFKFDKPVSWKEHDAQGGEAALEFQKTSPATMSMELVFDTTNDSGDVRQVWVNKLLELTNPTEHPVDGEAEGMTKDRPPRVLFGWGTFQLTGVITSVNVQYIMFSPKGTPLRAKVSVAMKEWDHSTYKGEGTGSYYNSEAVQVVQLEAGQTLTALALDHGTTTQAIAEANGIDDPMNVPPGTDVMIPK